MRDRETDSWWSIMTSRAIGGQMEGAELVELPVSTRTTFGKWVRSHPDTLVLSIHGEEHSESSRYADYLASPDTFGGLEVSDRRLEPKAPIFGFFLEGRPYVAPHEAFEGGKLFELGEAADSAILLFRPKGASMFDSTRAYRVARQVLERTRKPKALLREADSGAVAGFEPLGGIDTFWYNWVAVNQQTKLLE